MFETSSEEEGGEESSIEVISPKRSEADKNVISLLQDSEEEDLLISSSSKKIEPSLRKRESLSDKSKKLLENLDKVKAIARKNEEEADRKRLEKERESFPEKVVVFDEDEDISTQEDEEVKGEVITLKIRFDTKNTQSYKVNPNEPLGNLMSQILSTQNKSKVTLNCDGETIKPHDTAMDFDFEDGDLIDAVVV